MASSNTQSEYFGPSGTMISLPQEEQPFPLFDLPHELLIMICEYAVTYDDLTHVTKPQTFQAADPGRPSPNFKGLIYIPIQPAICRVNRLLREECVKLFYEKNTFVALEGNGGSWLKTVRAHWKHLNRLLVNGTNTKKVREYFLSFGLQLKASENMNVVRISAEERGTLRQSWCTTFGNFFVVSFRIQSQDSDHLQQD